MDAYLAGANLLGAHLELTNLEDVLHLSAEQLLNACGNAATRPPAGEERPAHWLEPTKDAGSEAAA